MRIVDALPPRASRGSRESRRSRSGFARPFVRTLVLLAVATTALVGCDAPDDGGPTPGPSAARTPEPSPRATRAPADRVLAGERLDAGERIETATESHRLRMQADGDLVLLEGSTMIWNTGTGGNPGASARLDNDGRLVVTSADGAELWSNGARSVGARLVVKPDGRVYEISADGEAVWSSRPPSYLASAPPAVNPNSPAALAAARAREQGRLGDAALLDKAAAQGSARWLTTSDSVAAVEAAARGYAAAAAAAGQTPVFVAYAIPDRDCGNHSAGGFAAPEYREWSAAVARGLAGARAVVVLEPDSLLHVYQCGDADERFALLREAGAAYAAVGAEVYLDAGTSSSFATDEKRLADIAARLKTAGVDRVAGFATNVANFQTTDDERAYGDKLSALLGGASFIIDTSRNGNGGLRDGGASVWCNPPGRALGEPPAATRDGAHVANLWVKTVGASDGSCNGGPPAGQYWEPYLLELAANAHW